MSRSSDDHSGGFKRGDRGDRKFSKESRYRGDSKEGSGGRRGERGGHSHPHDKERGRDRDRDRDGGREARPPRDAALREGGEPQQRHRENEKEPRRDNAAMRPGSKHPSYQDRKQRGPQGAHAAHQNQGLAPGASAHSSAHSHSSKKPHDSRKKHFTEHPKHNVHKRPHLPSKPGVYKINWWFRMVKFVKSIFKSN